jgi:hypothetical protein
MRREQRSRSSKTYSISWPDEDGLITREDNSDFTLTLGVDYVESNYSKIPVLNRLLNAGMGLLAAVDAKTSVKLRVLQRRCSSATALSPFSGCTAWLR